MTQPQRRPASSSPDPVLITDAARSYEEELAGAQAPVRPDDGHAGAVHGAGGGLLRDSLAGGHAPDHLDPAALDGRAHRERPAAPQEREGQPLRGRPAGAGGPPAPGYRLRSPGFRRPGGRRFGVDGTSSTTATSHRTPAAPADGLRPAAQPARSAASGPAPASHAASSPASKASPAPVASTTSTAEGAHSAHTVAVHPARARRPRRDDHGARDVQQRHGRGGLG